MLTIDLDKINIKDEQIKLKNISNSDLFDHNQELKDLEILFTKVENDN